MPTAHTIRHFPLTFGRTHLFSETDIGDQARNMNKKLISAMKQRELGSEQVLECKRVSLRPVLPILMILGNPAILYEQASKLR